MLKSNLEILEYVHSCPNHSVDADTLAAFIGDSAEKRLSDLYHENLLARSSNWYGDGVVVYSLSGKGFDLLAKTHQTNQQRAQDRADQAANEARAQQHADYLAGLNRRTMFVSGIISAIVSALMSILIRLLFG
ncbi:MAG: hypothetical protein E7337_10930 [Clostridiales bacterium]|nr:hypothetical protein [Clostridiales bacterium]